ncbi:serine/threonine-protein kinase VRK1-like [Anthonomus grandis grandis]|uniref:serine/threonine-protein kinase VRK1-like n=1 Tax=Anthonomus grandis grandis TaxID=2921223 RepID=UPI002165CEB2|nr:serine/threonine-protein kinase VRK1-like [Anthonomus grandis grandis]
MPPKKKAANGYKFAEPLPKGTVLQDLAKKQWKLGPCIGKGGFGEIYSAQEESARGTQYPYVVKIEPHANGPLFVEINFYIRHAKVEDINNFKKEKGLKSLGMPVYYGSGSHEYKGEKYRFLVMDKFSTDLYKLYLENHKVFPVDTVFKLGIQILDVLEYIHERKYVHADIKAANVLLGATKDTQNKQAYLVDFGLATKYTTDKEFKPNPKKAHDGTIEFLSRDAHQGVQTRRGDLEILAYNLIQWLGCKLPWEDRLGDPKKVQSMKEECMETVPGMIKACFGTKSYPNAIVEYLKYLQTLKFNTEPNYEKIKEIFLAGVEEGGGKVGTAFGFSGKTPLKRVATPASATRSKSRKVEVAPPSGDETPKKSKKGRTKKTIKVETNGVVSDTEVQEDGVSEFVTKRKKLRKISKSLDNLAEPAADPFAGFTSEMKEIVLKKMAKDKKKPKKVPKTTTVEVTNGNGDDEMAGYTKEMREIALKKKARETAKKAKTKPAVVTATTSSASDKRGLVKTTSKRLKSKPPKNHGEAVGYSDESCSE